MMTKVKDIFEPIYGVNLEFNKMTPDEKGIPFVARGSTNNGVVGYVKIEENINPNPANTISVAASGSVLESFYQEQSYYSGRDLYYLKPKVPLTKKQMLFYCLVIKSNKYRYSYGRQANKTIGEIKVPSLEELPKWVNEIDIPKQPNPNPYHKKKVSLDDRDWNWFTIEKVFDNITGTKTTPLSKLEEIGSGNNPYVTTQAVNNGVDAFFDFNTEKGNVITVDSAVIGFCSYQSIDFSASDHVEKIELESLNVYKALFLVTILNKEQYRYSYGRKRSQTRIRKEKIKLPVTNEGKPDWEFMEYYIKSLPYSINLEKGKTKGKSKEGLSDGELIDKYEAGEVDMEGAAKKMLNKPPHVN
jgi:hypothetical protein